MRKIWTKKYTILLAAVIIAVFLIYGVSYFYVIKPLKDEKGDLDRQVSTYETQYERITNESAGGSIDEELEDVAVKLPNQKAPDNVLTTLQELADASNVTITYVESVIENEDAEADGKRDVMNSHPYSLDASAENLADMNQFLEAMRASERLLIIDTLYIDQSGDLVDLSITFRVFSAS